MHYTVNLFISLIGAKVNQGGSLERVTFCLFSPCSLLSIISIVGVNCELFKSCEVYEPFQNFRSSVRVTTFNLRVDSVSLFNRNNLQALSLLGVNAAYIVHLILFILRVSLSIYLVQFDKNGEYFL